MQPLESLFNNVIALIGITDLIDIAIVAFVVYKVLGFIRETRAAQLVKGLVFLLVATFLSDIFNLYTVNWILRGTMTLGVVALVVIFQPELRRGLEYIGRSKFTSGQFGTVDKEKSKKMVSEFVHAIEKFSTSKVGALIVIERETALTDIVETGTIIDAAISDELLGNIFYEGAPLHDGAVVVSGDRLKAAGCVLPLTQNKSLGKELGTRHRAGIGITENSDAISIIVSEETGIISMAIDGRLSRFLDVKTVEKTLLNIYLANGNDKKINIPIPTIIDKKIKDKLNRKNKDNAQE